MHIQVITLFPEMFDGVLSSSMLGIAAKKGIVKYSLINLRDYGLGPYNQVDDKPYGGGNGMLLMIEPLSKAIKQALSVTPGAKVILPTPRGKLYRQSDAKHLSNQDDLIIICPRYEGYDERVLKYVDYSYCIGNYVLTGGELPAMIILDSVTRLLPGVLGGENSAAEESFYDDDVTSEYPHYTRPEEFEGMTVPSVLLSGNHQEILKWRNQNKQF